MRYINFPRIKGYLFLLQNLYYNPNKQKLQDVRADKNLPTWILNYILNLAQCIFKKNPAITYAELLNVFDTYDEISSTTKDKMRNKHLMLCLVVQKKIPEIEIIELCAFLGVKEGSVERYNRLLSQPHNLMVDDANRVLFKALDAITFSRPITDTKPTPSVKKEVIPTRARGVGLSLSDMETKCSQLDKIVPSTLLPNQFNRICASIISKNFSISNIYLQFDNGGGKLAMSDLAKFVISYWLFVSTTNVTRSRTIVAWATFYSDEVSRPQLYVYVNSFHPKISQDKQYLIVLDKILTGLQAYFKKTKNK